MLGRPLLKPLNEWYFECSPRIASWDVKTNSACLFRLKIVVSFHILFAILELTQSGNAQQYGLCQSFTNLFSNESIKYLHSIMYQNGNLNQTWDVVKGI